MTAIPISSFLFQLEKDELAQQLSETFTPEDGPLFSSIPSLDWDALQAFGPSEGCLSLDEVQQFHNNYYNYRYY